MKKNFSRVISVFMSMLLVCSLFSVAFASNFDFTGDNDLTANDAGLGDTASSVLGLIQWVGYAIAVGMIIYIGIRYMSASANEKADLKNGLIKFVIGVVVIATASTLAGVVSEILK